MINKKTNMKMNQILHGTDSTIILGNDDANIINKVNKVKKEYQRQGDILTYLTDVYPTNWIDKIRIRIFKIKYEQVKHDPDYFTLYKPINL